MVDLEGSVQVALGKGDHSMADAVFLKPLDAAFWGDTLAVLDAASPWIRLFTADGEFLGSIGAEGEGPGEADWPWGISVVQDSLLVLIHSRGWDSFDRGGQLVHTVRPTGRITGLVDLCGETTLGLVVPPGNRNPAFFGLLGWDGTVTDTVTMVGRTRGRSRIYHALMSASLENGALVYNEGSGGEGAWNRIDCAGRFVGSEALPDSLGLGESVRPGPNGRTIVAGPSRPTPAGLAAAGRHHYWATHRVVEGDSVTTLTRINDEGFAERRELVGWYTLLDGSPDGDLLLSNAWTARQRWSVGDVWGTAEPLVFRVRATDLFSSF